MDYKEKLELARDWYNDQSTTKKEKVLLENLFPELKESKDERIRSAMLRGFNSMYANQALSTFAGESIRDIIAWLEKQGKVKHTCQNCQTFKDLHQNCPYSPIYQYKDLTEAHKHLNDETNCDFWLEKQGEQKPTDSYCKEHCKGFQETGKCFADGECKAKKDAEQNHAWSEEDEKKLNDTIFFLNEFNEVYHDDAQNCIDWLKSLKPQSRWKPTEEQIHCFKCVIDFYKTKVNDTIVLNLLNSLYEQLVKL